MTPSMSPAASISCSTRTPTSKRTAATPASRFCLRWLADDSDEQFAAG